ncbi:MAG: hypothetical protein HZC22_13355 [Rhodocyclales bacterium]|nr:hypothetical protein [Rhodocyclales bacterium]
MKKTLFSKIRLIAAAGLLAIASFAYAGALTDAAENKLADAVLRGQALGAPTTGHVGILTACPTDSTAGTEVTGGSYARVAVTSSLANWSGTQGAGTTVASSGTGGTILNNNAITFPAPTANWGTITCWGIYDSASGGVLWIYAPLTVNKTVNNGDAAPSFAPGAATFQIDN